MFYRILLLSTTYVLTRSNPKIYTVQDGSADTEFALTTVTDSNNNIYVGGYGYGSIDGEPYAGGEVRRSISKLIMIQLKIDLLLLY